MHLRECGLKPSLTGTLLPLVFVKVLVLCLEFVVNLFSVHSDLVKTT